MIFQLQQASISKNLHFDLRVGSEF